MTPSLTDIYKALLISPDCDCTCPACEEYRLYKEELLKEQEQGIYVPFWKKGTLVNPADTGFTSTNDWRTYTGTTWRTYTGTAGNSTTAINTTFSADAFQR